jgi:hypothetical protein
MHGEVLEGRECGTCNVCCISLTIEEPTLKKVQGYRCRHLTAEKQCGIYADRPDTCRTFNCGWRLLRWVKPTLRPDGSQVLIRLKYSTDKRLGIIVHLLGRTALNAVGLAETVAAAVNAGCPVFVAVPGPPGYTSAEAQLDEALTVAVAARDKPAVLNILRQAYRQGKAGKTVPIRLDGPEKTAAAPA